MRPSLTYSHRVRRLDPRAPRNRRADRAFRLARWAQWSSRSSPPNAAPSAVAPIAGSFDHALAYAVLDEAYVAHVGFVVDGSPRVLPMTYGRVDGALYLHGAVGNAMLRRVGTTPTCA